MKQNNKGSQITLCFGVVKNNADPAQHGRLQVFLPAVDTKDYEVDDLPWANYVSPFGGVTVDFKAGREQDNIPGGSSYGLWAIPKNSAQVLCGFLEGEPSVRFWMGCFFQPELNRTLPQSIHPIKTEIDESGLYPQEEIPHYRTNLNEAGLAPEHLHYKTRGGYERSVSHPSNKNNNKPLDDGYDSKPNEPDKADSQTISLTSPGRHFMSMSDVKTDCHVRMKTTAGNQVILDDTNERIYISTAMGRNWIEIDEGSGKIYFYTASKFSIHSENDINMYSDQNINIVAKKRVNIQSEERGVKIQAKMGVSILSSAADIKITASGDIHLKATGGESAGSVSASTSCNKPPYSGGTLGLVRDFAEDAGGTGKIMINAAVDIDVRSDGGAVHVTAPEEVGITSMATVGLQAPEVGISGGSFSTSVGKIGMYAIDHIDSNYHEPILSEHDASAPGTAGSADSVDGETIKDSMIVPLHDDANGWVRDEDEDDCPTPRNKNYVG